MNKLEFFMNRYYDFIRKWDLQDTASNFSFFVNMQKIFEGGSND